MAMDIVEIQKSLSKVQGKHRYVHTLGVQYTSAALAMTYGCDLNKAQLAGLLHDCAKTLSSKKLLKICEENHLPISETEHKNPFLLHGKAGAVLAKKYYDIADEDILNAIRHHTTGRPDMSLLEKIVFIADYIEPGRNSAPNLDELRKLCFTNLDQGVCAILKQTLDFLKNHKDNIDYQTVETYQYYKKQLEGVNYE